ncbi:hypothetical protein BT93_K1721 [Corymbia citriodora subsp. variegata]|nr:hypothetical protein BT93_K1721 [Corymbia citriodora subsp. variegata]KAF8007815.1 hypothetical protein BT93_K1721 [Corymbia citriodora subsp. variegata]
MKKAYGVDRVILSLNIRFSCVFDAKPVLDFGRKALFYVGVLSGYKERSITSFRLQLEKYLRQAHERKASSRKVPEQVILTQVCHLVEKMQALNKKLEDSDTAIEENFKPIDKQAEAIMIMQLDGVEKTM